MTIIDTPPALTSSGAALTRSRALLSRSSPPHRMLWMEASFERDLLRLPGTVHRPGGNLDTKAAR